MHAGDGEVPPERGRPVHVPRPRLPARPADDDAVPADPAAADPRGSYAVSVLLEAQEFVEVCAQLCCGRLSLFLVAICVEVTRDSELLDVTLLGDGSRRLRSASGRFLTVIFASYSFILHYSLRPVPYREPGFIYTVRSASLL